MYQGLVVILGLGLIVLTMCGVSVSPPEDSPKERARNQAVIKSLVPQEEEDALKIQRRRIFEIEEEPRQRKLAILSVPAAPGVTPAADALTQAKNIETAKGSFDTQP